MIQSDPEWNIREEELVDQISCVCHKNQSAQCSKGQATESRRQPKASKQSNGHHLNDDNDSNRRWSPPLDCKGHQERKNQHERSQRKTDESAASEQCMAEIAHGA